KLCPTYRLAEMTLFPRFMTDPEIEPENGPPQSSAPETEPHPEAPPHRLRDLRELPAPGCRRSDRHVRNADARPRSAALRDHADRAPRKGTEVGPGPLLLRRSDGGRGASERTEVRHAHRLRRHGDARDDEGRAHARLHSPGIEDRAPHLLGLHRL